MQRRCRLLDQNKQTFLFSSEEAMFRNGFILVCLKAGPSLHVTV